MGQLFGSVVYKEGGERMFQLACPRRLLCMSVVVLPVCQALLVPTVTAMVVVVVMAPPVSTAMRVGRVILVRGCMIWRRHGV